MMSCNGYKNRNTWRCETCIECSKYTSDTLTNPQLAMDIDKEMKMLAKAGLNKIFGVQNAERKTDMRIKKVYFNDPVTVVLWEDGTKSIVRTCAGDIYDPEKGLAMAIAKKALGNQGNYYEAFKKWLPEEKDEESVSALDGLKQALANLTIPKLSISACEDDTGVRKTVMLTPEELAERLGVTKATIQKKCRQGKYPGAVKVGGKWKIPY